MGMFAVGTACALSGQVCRHAKRELDSGCGPVRLFLSLPHSFDKMKVEEVLVDALLGSLCFKVRLIHSVRLVWSFFVSVSCDACTVADSVGVEVHRQQITPSIDLRSSKSQARRGLPDCR